MPQLPTITVTDAQATRLLAAFGSVENYTAWLSEQLVRYVIAKESEAIWSEAANKVSEAERTLRESI